MDRNFEYWVLLTLFSLVNLSSLNNAFEEGSSSDWSSQQKWVVSVAAVSLILSFMACACQLVAHERFCGKPPEGILVRASITL